MVDPVDVIGGLVGYGAGVSYQFVISLVTAVATGDHAAIVRLVYTVIALWIGLIILRRSLRMIWGVLITALKLSIVVGCFIVALSIYHDGVDKTFMTGVAYGYDLLGYFKGKVEPTKDYVRAAQGLVDSEAVRLVEQVQKLKHEIFA